MPGLLHAVQTQVIGTPLEQSHPDGQAQHLYQPRNVAGKQLVLQSFGCCRHQGPLATQQHGYQIGIGFAHARAGLDHQLPTLLECLCDRHGHVGLASPGLKTGHSLRQDAMARQRLGDPLNEQAQAGSLGSSIRCNLAI